MKYVEIGNKLIIIHTRFLGGNVLRILGRLLRSPRVSCRPMDLWPIENMATILGSPATFARPPKTYALIITGFVLHYPQQLVHRQTTLFPFAFLSFRSRGGDGDQLSPTAIFSLQFTSFNATLGELIIYIC